VNPLALRFTVFGTPQPKGSKSAFPIRRKGGGLGVSVREGKPGSPFEEWRRRVESVVQDLAERQNLARRGNGLLTGPLRVRMDFVFAKPKSAPKSRLHPDVRPDLGKLVRGVEDAMTGSLIKDDAQIVSLDVSKEYGAPPRVEVFVWPARGLM
jgi:Holliday junction resolvase RusA-like endonuclease